MTENSTRFKSKNLMFKKSITRMLHYNYIPEPWDTLSILDGDDNLISYHSSYSDDFLDAVLENGIFLVLAVMEYRDFENAKVIEFGKAEPWEFRLEFIVTTFKRRNIFSIPECSCPDYESPEFFGVKITKTGDEYDLTFGMSYRRTYDIEFDRGYEDIEIIYADEIQKATDKIPAKFIPFADSDDIKDKFSAANLINPTLVRFMYEALKFK